MIPTRQENNDIWPCRAVQLRSVFWWKGEDAWFVTTIWRWHHGSYTHTDGSQFRKNTDLRAGEEDQHRRDTERGSHKSAFSEESKVDNQRGGWGWGAIALVQKFLHYCPPPSPHLKPVSSITQIICRPQGIGDLISLYVFPRIFHFICLLRLNQGK